MLVELIDPDLIAYTSLLLLSIVQNVFCRPKGARRGSSIAVFGGAGGNSVMPSDKWGDNDIDYRALKELNEDDVAEFNTLGQRFRFHSGIKTLHPVMQPVVLGIGSSAPNVN